MTLAKCHYFIYRVYVPDRILVHVPVRVPVCIHVRVPVCDRVPVRVVVRVPVHFRVHFPFHVLVSVRTLSVSMSKSMFMFMFMFTDRYTETHSGPLNMKNASTDKTKRVSDPSKQISAGFQAPVNKF